MGITVSHEVHRTSAEVKWSPGPPLLEPLVPSPEFARTVSPRVQASTNPHLSLEKQLQWPNQLTVTMHPVASEGQLYKQPWKYFTCLCLDNSQKALIFPLLGTGVLLIAFRSLLANRPIGPICMLRYSSPESVVLWVGDSESGPVCSWAPTRKLGSLLTICSLVGSFPKCTRTDPAPSGVYWTFFYFHSNYFSQVCM
jgi:hypothetical protein